MKKFFKTLSLLIIVLLLVFSLVFNYNVMTATADDSDTEDNGQYIDTRDYDLYQIDDVESLTTSELLEEVMNYPNTRLDYNWYSSDETIAKVSSFGTVTATCLWQENVNSRQVTITAVYKYDYSVIGTIVLTVYKDDSSINDITYLQYGMDVRESGTISGTEVTSGLGSTISVTYNPTVTIHTNKTRLICLGLDSPTSSIQDYTWTSGNDYYAQVSSFGTIFANNFGTVTISGINKYNSRYRVSITITII